MQFALLGSGSGGNALVLASAHTRVLIDGGVSCREMIRRLAACGLSPRDLHAILLTHEHSDHSQGVLRLARQANLPIFATWGTCHALGWLETAPKAVTIELIDCFSAWFVGEIHCQPFPVPHDAREPVQFVFSGSGRRLGVMTDVGHITPHMQRHLQGCHSLILECNHDPEALARSAYPPNLKRRIAGAYGHLSNFAAAQLLATVQHPDLRQVVAAHMSEENNHPQKVTEALLPVLSALEQLKFASDLQLQWSEV